MRGDRRSGIVLAALVSLSTACGAKESTSPSDAGTDAGGSSFATACRAYAQSLCAREQACSPFFVEYGFGSLAACEDAVRYRCGSLGVLTGVTWSSTQVGACASALDAMSCAQLWSGHDPCGAPAGTEPEGAPCYYGEQCASQYCGNGGGGTCGACAKATAPGDGCSTGGCSSGQRCWMGECTAIVSAGAACTSSGACPVNQGCFGGTCVPRGKEGDPCDNTGVAAPDCDFLSGVTCVAGTCAPIALAGVGESCGYLGATMTLCSGGGACATTSGGSGTCQATVPLGQPCSTAQTCTPGAMCVNGVCRVPDATSCR